ncbi:hypothetical protein DL767_006699 [Monosporascus sp. MG133]|nr:hypothetical protein DL767_006699 [Monosporascus sp. MG133]
MADRSKKRGGVPDSTEEDRPQKRQATRTTQPAPPSDLSDIYHGSNWLAAQSSFVGQGAPHSEKTAQCLADLRSSDPRHDKKRIEQTKGGLLRESYRWILDHDDFLRWRDDPDSRLLWIKGDPGKGKTMLLCGIIDELKEQTANTTHLLSFFFCQATDDRLNNATAILRGLIYLLVDQQRSLISHIQDKYNHAGKALFEDVNAWVALSDILTSILQDPSLPDTTLIIDALDECETDLTQLLDLIMKVSLRSHIKWLFSSRNRIDIEQKLRPDRSRTRLSLELKSNADHVSHAVDAYIDHCISEIPAIRNDPQLQTQVRDQIRRKAGGTFLWVGLVAQELKEAQSWHVMRIMDEVLPGLEELYWRMMRQIQGLRRKDPEIGAVHYDIFSRSLDILSKTLRRDIYRLDDPELPTDQVTPPDPDPLAAARYSCIHWVDHLAECKPYEQVRYGSLQDGGIIDRFLRRHYLHWLEALSILGNVSEGILAMSKLNGLFQPAVEHNWTACLSTFEGHGGSVYSVAFSPDGSRLASGSYDRTVKVWDAATGACLSTLEGHGGEVNSVAFSPNGSRLASGSYDGTVKVWDAATGAYLLILAGHGDSVYSVAFSPDGNYLITNTGIIPLPASSKIGPLPTVLQHSPNDYYNLGLLGRFGTGYCGRLRIRAGLDVDLCI